ncbi:hypothetical protein OS493_022200 [Desmophyllum pertusum]|uniref:EGF-like domain-containing protein n=1 Tax=Desmophyllum pertusum TaxID=174260 RepID=A0A9W9YAP0_9CNID|nr:hypothetical protein OS493_022200 [Desmophyllum pertusum]
MCRDDCRCLSMNYIHNNDRDNCELNDVNEQMKPAALKYKPGASYYDLIREYTNDHGTSFVLGRDHCINRCCWPNPCSNGGSCEEICDPTTVRFHCTCPANYTGQRCEKIVRSCKGLATNGAKLSGMYRVYDSQNKSFQVYCDFDSEVGHVWTLMQSYSFGNNSHFDTKNFGVDFPVNQDAGAIKWVAYRLSLSRMLSIANVSTHLRATCNFQDDGLVYTDYARAKLEGHNLFGTFKGTCRMYELVNIRGIECRDCTALTRQTQDKMWYINSYSTSKGCTFNGSEGSVQQEQNFGRYAYSNPEFRCTSNLNSTTQHWIGSKLP